MCGTWVFVAAMSRKLKWLCHIERAKVFLGLRQYQMAMNDINDVS
jgi:hypothetical protein